MRYTPIEKEEKLDDGRWLITYVDGTTEIYLGSQAHRIGEADG